MLFTLCFLIAKRIFLSRNSCKNINELINAKFSPVGRVDMDKNSASFFTV